MTTIADRLRMVRAHLKETQKGLSRRLGIGVMTWQSYEITGRIPKQATLEKLAEMGFSVAWIVTGEGEMLASANPVPAERGLVADWAAAVFDLPARARPALDDTGGSMFERQKEMQLKVSEACDALSLNLSPENIVTLSLIAFYVTDKKMQDDLLAAILGVLKTELNRAS